MLRFQLPCVRPFDYRNKCFVSSESLYRKHPNIEKIIPMVNPVDLNIPPDYIVLGIESSCDDTSVCLLQKSHQTLIPTILYEKTIHQTNIHKYYGGVVPYLASKEHRHHLPLLLKEIIDIFGRSQGRTFPGFDFVAATRGPGLPASLSAGWHSAKTLSAALNIPLMGVHHMEGHALMAQFENSDLLFPFYALLLSGGHTLLLEMESLGKYHIIGQSLDDNIGESLDKGARNLGLEWMEVSGSDGGLAAQLELVSMQGNPGAFQFPLPLTIGGRDYGFNFSFSGLKSSLLNHLGKLRLNQRPIENNDPEGNGSIGKLSSQQVCDLAASYQAAVFGHILNRLQLYQKKKGFRTSLPLVVSGGVARNKALRAMLETYCREDLKMKVIFANPKYSTDNALMIANTGIRRIEANLPFQNGLFLETKPEWPLTDLLV